mgnify:CR=1 FL=1
MSNGILVTFAGYPYTPSSLFPDNGLANMAASLLANGHGIKIWDLNTLSTMERLMTPALRVDMRRLLGLYKLVGRDEEATAFAQDLDRRVEAHMAEESLRMADELCAEVEAGGYDWVGFKLYMGDGLRNSVRMAERIRERLPGLKLFAGGPQADLVRDAVYRRTRVFDAVAVGEGEWTIVCLADWVDGKGTLAAVPNILYFEGEQIVATPEQRIPDLNQIATPVYDVEIYPAMAGDEKIKILTYDESRGCPYQCAFCIHAAKSGINRRVKDPALIAQELDDLSTRYDTRLFRLAGSSTPYYTLFQVTQQLIERGTEVMFSAYGTPYSLDPAYLPTLTAGGMWGIFFGVESGSPRILERMNKNKNRIDGMEKTIRACLDAGMFVVSSMLYPAPGEDEESTRETLDFLRRVFTGYDHYSIPVTFAGLMPNTAWFREREKYGFHIDDEQDYLQEVMDFRIKALMPYALWPRASYVLDGQPQHALAMRSGWLLEQLRSEGFTTMLLDDTAIVATLADIPLERALDELVAIFLTGDMEGARRIARRVNARASLKGGPLPRAVPRAERATA